MVHISELIENGKVYLCDFKSRDDLYAYLADDLNAQDYVQDTFLSALKEREATFPTGIIATCYNIALPHVDAVHVKKNALIIAVLNHPINYVRMDKLDEQINVKVVFMLLIKDISVHTQAISSLAKLWFNQTFMNAVLSVKSKEELVALVKQAEAE